MQFTQEEKVEIVDEARNLIMDRHPEVVDVVNGKRQVAMPTGNCVLSSLAMIEVLIKHNIRAIIQAGSCLWRYKPDECSGVTHFGWVYGDNEPIPQQLSHKARLKGLLPELHVWVAIPDSLEIVDIETARFPHVAKNMIGVQWDESLLPPDFLWTSQDKVMWELDCSYMPSMEAIQEVLEFVKLGKAGEFKIKYLKSKEDN